MIGFLRGKVAGLSPDSCFLDVQGVGYRVFVSASTRGRLRSGEEAMLYTHLAVREDAMLLYGFLQQEEYDLFQLLISVSGIGPKVALGILSAIGVGDLCRALRGQQITALTKLPGIGKKTAERMILELKDKVGSVDDGAVAEGEALTAFVGGTHAEEAMAALLTLGYSAAEIEPVLRRAGHCSTAEEMIRFALRAFAGGK
ncbi:MAG: Holliday junction branch migration protein RuvA [Schwartzia sp. (in: firmicutes)]